MNSLAELSDFAARLRKAMGTPIPSDWFDRFALELFALQFERNAPYRRFCEARGARPQNVTQWRQIPAMPALAFKEFDLSCLPVEERTRVFYSSGTTTQRPSRHFHNADSLAIYEASLWPWFAEHLLAPAKAHSYAAAIFSLSSPKGGEGRGEEDKNLQTGFPSPQPSPRSGGERETAAVPRYAWAASTPPMSLLCLTPTPGDAPQSSLAHMFETIRCKMGSAESAFLGGAGEDGAWTLDLELALSTLRLATASAKPVLLLGTAFSFVHLIDFMAERNIHLELPPGSRALETGGYKGRSRVLPKAELHALITRRLGIPPAQIVCEYGMSELGSQAYDIAVGEAPRMRRGPAELLSPPARCFRFPPWARIQVISPETGDEVNPGETGLIRVFDLANVYSVMAIQTEDLGLSRADGFELIGRAALAEPRGCSLMAV